MQEPIPGAEGGVETEDDEELEVSPANAATQEETVVVQDIDTLSVKTFLFYFLLIHVLFRIINI